MGLPGEVKSSFQALVESGNIRYEAFPTAIVAIADDAAWDQLFAAAGAPATDFWLCGFSYSYATGLVADVSLLIDLGYGGVDGAAIAAATVLLTNWPVCITAGVAAVGPASIPAEMLPYPVKIPGGSRMAARIASSPTGTLALVEFRVILATAVGN